MSRSHSYSSNYSRGSRSSQTPNLAVTEASFQGLQLSDTSLPSSYSTSNQYSSRGSYGQSDSLNPNYLTPSYDTSSYPSSSPSGSYLGSQRGVSPFAALDSESGTYYDPEASAYNRTDMSSYSYHRTAVPSTYESHGTYPSSRSPSMHDYVYAGGDSSRRSMSYSSGPHILPSSVLDTFSTEDREVARQRRRRLQESRRLAKARVRRTRLPTIVEPDASMEMNMGRSIDFLAAPSTSSSYEIGGSSGYPRTTSSSSAPYLSGVTGSSNPYEPSYSSSYGVGDVAAHSLYPAPTSRLPSHPSTSGSYRTSRTVSLAPSTSPHPDDAIRIVENPRKPQCWDHGCNGRQFSTFSNLLRHQREKSGTATKSYCPRCGAEFTRTTARNGHMAHDKCKPRPQN